MNDIVLSQGDIFLTHGDIYLHGNSKIKIGSGMKPYNNNTIRRMTSQVNHPSTGLQGLGTQNDILSRSAFKPSGTSVIFGGSVSSQLGRLNFNTDKKK